MSVTAIIVTRGDVDLTQIIQSIPKDWQCLVWNNGSEKLLDYDLANHYTTFSRATWFEVEDLSVYGRYAAIEHAVGDLIYVQDDDCIVEDPAYIVDTFMHAPAEAVVCNMPQEFRHSFYEDHALVGFGRRSTETPPIERCGDSQEVGARPRDGYAARKASVLAIERATSCSRG